MESCSWRHATDGSDLPYRSDGKVVTSPKVADGIVYAASDDNSVYAVDAISGERLWKHNVGHGFISGLTVTDDALYVGEFGALALEIGETASQARLLWTHPSGSPLHAPPALADGVIYLNAEDGYIYALDAASGDGLWRYRTGGVRPALALPEDKLSERYARSLFRDLLTADWRYHYAVGNALYSSPAVANGVVYAGAGVSLFALDAASGELLWRYQTGADDLISPVVAAGIVYAGAADNLHALDAVSGQQVWRFQARGYLRSPPVVTEGVVYFTTGDENGRGHVYALDAGVGEAVWHAVSDDFISVTPVVTAGAAFVGTHGGYVYAFDAGTGAELWRHFVDTGIYGAPLVVDGVVFGGQYAGVLFALDAATGDRLWSFDTDRNVFFAPAVVDGVVYSSAVSGPLYALDAATGKILWQSDTPFGLAFTPVVVDDVVYYAGSANRYVYALRGSNGDCSGAKLPKTAPRLPCQYARESSMSSPMTEAWTPCAPKQSTRARENVLSHRLIEWFLSLPPAASPIGR